MIARKGQAAQIAAARRAARTAQKELQGAEAKSVMSRDGFGGDGMAEPGFLPLRRGRGLLVRYKRRLVLGGALLLAAIGAYAMARTFTYNRFSDFVPQFLKQFDRGAVRAKSAAAGEAFPNNTPASRTLPRDTAALTRTSQLAAMQSPAANRKKARGWEVPAAIAAAPIDPLAPVEPGFSGKGVGRSGYPPLAMRVIGGSDAIVADTLSRNNAASNFTRPRPLAAITPAMPCQNPPRRRQLSPEPQPLRQLRQPPSQRRLSSNSKSGDATAQFDLAVHYAEASSGERNYELAAQWYGKAAEQGLAVAEYRLASLYEKGLGVGRDM